MCECLRGRRRRRLLHAAIHISRGSSGCFRRGGGRELQAGPAAMWARDTDFPCEFPFTPRDVQARVYSGVLIPCRGVATPQAAEEAVREYERTHREEFV